MKYEKPKLMKYGHQNYWVEKALIAFFVAWAIATICKATSQEHTHRTHTLTREQKVVAITILAEARGEGNAGMYAVAAVIAQRSFERKRTPEQVCLKPYQFSCWNVGDPNRLEMSSIDLEDVSMRECHWAALTVILGTHADNTEGSCHYHTHGVSPDWSKGLRPVKWIGDHLFFNDVE